MAAPNQPYVACCSRLSCCLCCTGHNYIGTEHILLGLLREGEGVAARVLETLGADPSKIRTQVRLWLRVECVECVECVSWAWRCRVHAQSVMVTTALGRRAAAED
jgi:hypothetical protein